MTRQALSLRLKARSDIHSRITERCFDLLESILRSTRDHIANCPCTDGCPSCIQSPKCGNNNEPLDKAAALSILDLLLG